MALVIKLFVAYIANVLDQILTDAVRKSPHVAPIPQLLHHLAAGFQALVIVATRMLNVPPVNCALQVV